MGGMRLLLGVCLGVAVAGAAGAECPPGAFHYAPGYGAPFKAYGYPADLRDRVTHKRAVSARTAKLCRGCDSPRRGVQLASRQDAGGGFFELGLPLGDTFCASALFDVSRMGADGAFAGLEFDSPAVPIDAIPMTYVFAAVQNTAGVLSVWTEVNGQPGAPLELPAGTEVVEVELHYGGGTVDVFAQPLGAAAPTPVLESQSFAWAGSGGLGSGSFDLAKGDRTGVAIEVSGDVFDAGLQDVLGDLAALLAACDDALAALDAALPQDAAVALEAVRGGVEDPGPAQEPSLLDRTRALPSGKPAKAAAKRLAKAAGLAAKLRDQLQAEGADLEKAHGRALKLRASLEQAERILETGATQEGKGAR
jgi:hypothetical protein